MGAQTTGVVIAVSRCADHIFSKNIQPSITLLQGLGVEGDAHCGSTVQHRSRVTQNPHQPNLRQVHLIQSELFEEVAKSGFQVTPGQLGENITTRGIDLLALPKATKLRIGSTVIVELTGLRNPCSQIDNFQTGLLSAVLDKDEQGNLIRKAGVMGIVLQGGEVKPDDSIEVELPPSPHEPLERV